MKVGVQIKDQDKGYKALMKRALGTKGVDLSVGVFAAEGEKTHVPKEAKGGTYPTVLDIATWNEFGTAKIPERSWLRGYIDTNTSRHKAMIVIVLKGVLQGKYDPKVGFERLGLQMQGEIQKRIATPGTFTPNAERTIALKGSSMPLIDTGVFRSSITYQVKILP